MKKIICLLIGSMLGAFTLQAEVFKICMDQRDWQPFTFKEGEAFKGMHIDIVVQALKKLGHEAQFSALPWLRCATKDGESGAVDAVMPATYQAEYAGFLSYPEDAAKPGESAWRIMQVDQALITFQSDPYIYKGDLKSLPNPLRLTVGDPLSAELEALGFKPEATRGDINNIGKLVRDKNGSVITSTILAESFDRDPQFKGKLNIHAVPINSKSYFLAFSKKGKVKDDLAKKIWTEIANLRDDYVYMLQLYAQY